MKAAPSRRARRKMHMWPVALGLLLLIVIVLITDPFHNGVEQGFIKSVELTSETETSREQQR